MIIPNFIRNEKRDSQFHSTLNINLTFLDFTSFQIGDSNYKKNKVDQGGESGDEEFPKKSPIIKTHHQQRVMPSTSQSDAHDTDKKINMIVRNQNDGVEQLYKEAHEMNKKLDNISNKKVPIHYF